MTAMSFPSRAAVAMIPISLLLSLAPAGHGAAHRRILAELEKTRAAKYEKVELTIRLDAEYANPFDPDEVDVSVEVAAPSGSRYTVPAFHYQPYEEKRLPQERRRRAWRYPCGPPIWKARLAPTETGTHRCRVRVRDSQGMAESEALVFESIPSAAKGFVRVSPRDPRFFQFSEGKAFFPIGQNLAFIGQEQYFDVDTLEAAFGKMQENGANFARIWACCEDWALAIEARKSAWGRSWSWNPPLALMPGRRGYFSDNKCLLLEDGQGKSLLLSPCHPVAVRPESKYVLSGRASLQGGAALAVNLDGRRLGEPLASERKKGDGNELLFRREIVTPPGQYWLPRLEFQLEKAGSARLRDLSLREAQGGPELLWEADLDRPAMGYYNPLDCFLLDQVVEAAERHGIYLQLCLLTRDLYMDLLASQDRPAYERAIRQAKKTLRYAVARWGYSTHVAAWEYFNEMNPGLPTDRFYDELGKYCEQVDPYRHLRTTSAWGPSPKDWRHPRLDVAQHHWYLRPAWGELWKDEVAAVADRVALLRQHAGHKPCMLAEFGLAGDQWQRSPYMDQDRELIHFRHSLWASALSGLSATALFWWWENLDRRDAYSHYRPLAQFVADVPFAEAALDAAKARVEPQAVHVVGLQGGDVAYLWLCNRQATWWRLVVEKVQPAAVRQATLEVQGLSPGDYHVEWWDTRTGRILERQALGTSGGALRLAVPEFAEDLGCKIRRSVLPPVPR
mgnify:CR=1 FL=1